MFGRIDVHGHLIPGVDDGCRDEEESVRCARVLVGAGFTHAFCTPHVWPSLPGNTVGEIVRRVGALQAHLDFAGLSLKLLPGGELNLESMGPRLKGMGKDEVPTYGMAGRYVLFDFWDESMKACRGVLWPALEVLQGWGMTPVLAHPERIGACRERGAVEAFVERGVLLQLNGWTLTTSPGSPTYRMAERLLKDGAYFMMGTDLHDPAGMESRMRGMKVVREMVGEAELDRLTKDGPAKLLEGVSV